MSKRQELTGPGKCVYCLRDVDEITSDHVIPLSWYPTSKPESVELPQAPACRECNEKYGRLETALRERLGMAIDRWIEGGEGIGDSSLRAIDPSKGKSERDVDIRRKKLTRYAKHVKRVKEVSPTETILPNIGQVVPGEEGFLVDSFDPVLIGKVVRKWIVGLTYHFETMYIDPNRYVVQAKKLGQNPPVWLRRGGMWTKLEIGPGIVIERRTVSEDPIVSFWVFSIWARFEFLGAVVSVDYLLETAFERTMARRF